MKRNRRNKAALLILGLPAVLLSLFAWLTWREVQQARLNHALILTLRHHETAQMVTLLHQGADPNARDVPEHPLTWRDLFDHWLHRSTASGLTDTALMVAVRADRRKEVDMLLRAGANPNASNAHQDTPISIALNADAPRADLIQDLLMHDVNPSTRMIDVQGPRHTTILIKIISNDYVDSTSSTIDAPARRLLVKLLLDRGADIRATDEDGQSPLLAASGQPASDQDAEIAHWLMERGADINQADHDGNTPLKSASGPILNELLRRGVDVAPAHNGGWNLLIWAADENNIPFVQTALKRGIPVNSRDKLQRTALMYAAAHGDLPVLRSLLAHGASANAQDKNGWTALMFAAQHGDVVVMRALLQHGANPRLRDREHGWTAAQRAASVGQEQTARWLRTGNPLQKVPPANPERRWRSPDDRGNPDPTRLRVDARRRIKFIRPKYAEDYQAVVVDNRGRNGKAYRCSWYVPGVRVFTDTDGRHYAWFIACHRLHSQKLMEIRGLDLVQRGKRKSTYGTGNYCQPLPDGGALLVVFRYLSDLSWNRTGVPAGHQDDNIAVVTRFRDGKLTDLGLLFMPQQQP